MAAFLRTLRALATEQFSGTSFSEEQAAEGLAVTDVLRALFLARTASAYSAIRRPAQLQKAEPANLLQLLPHELLAVILSHLDTRALALVAATCQSLWLDAPTPPPPPRAICPVEAELRRRAEARGLHISSSLPEGAPSWVSYLLASNRRDALRREVPLAVGAGIYSCSMFVDSEGRLLTCGYDPGNNHHLGHAVADRTVPRFNGPPTLVPSVQDRRFVSVATCEYGYCLALSAEGEVYSWGGDIGLGHGDDVHREVPTRIESLSRVEYIAARNSLFTSAVIDENGSLYTWGEYEVDENDIEGPYGLGYEADGWNSRQLIPKKVDALSQYRVVGVALGQFFTLVVTDAGDVFSFGCGGGGMLGHGSTTNEVLPRKIQALAQTGRRFVAVAAGHRHALALIEAGELYGWGERRCDGPFWLMPKRIVELVGTQVKLIYANYKSSCAVTENGALFSWSTRTDLTNHLGHGVRAVQHGPKRVERLSRVKVALAAMCETHTLVADEDGVVWGFGSCHALGLDDNPAAFPEFDVLEHPMEIPALRVRARKSPPVVRM